VRNAARLSVLARIALIVPQPYSVAIELEARTTVTNLVDDVHAVLRPP